MKLQRKISSPFTRHIDRLTAAFTILFLAAALTACGGSSSGDNNSDQFSNFTGDFESENCWNVAPDPALTSYSGLKVSSKFSSVSGGLHVVKTFTYYHNSRNPGIECGVPVGSSTVSIALVYTGNLGSVPFTRNQHAPLAADKFQATYQNVVNEGTPSTLWSSLDKFVESKILLASDAQHIYVSDFNSPRDAEGYPTLLTSSNWFLP